MHHFTYKNEVLHCEEVPIPEIAAAVGTPFYCYSAATLRRHFQAFDSAFDLPHLCCYAVKACSNIAILRLFAAMGSGADIVSGGELHRALAAGIPADRIVFSGVGKTKRELREALTAGILQFNVESAQELEALAGEAAALGVEAPVALRVNPDVDPKTHAYISTGLATNKFGIPEAEALELYRRAAQMPHVRVQGVSCHIGSQLTEVSPFVEALDKMAAFVARLRRDGITVSWLDLGGGLGITYEDEEPPSPAEYAAALGHTTATLGCRLILEPGRVIVGNAGILVCSTLYTKQGGKRFIIVDAAMNDLARPSLYDAFHRVQAVERPQRPRVRADLVGPICETGDFLARDQELPDLAPGDLVAVMSAGAYGFSMSSNYNSRGRAAEVLVDGGRFAVIRERETYDDLVRGESIPDFIEKRCDSPSGSAN